MLAIRPRKISACGLLTRQNSPRAALIRELHGHLAGGCGESGIAIPST